MNYLPFCGYWFYVGAGDGTVPHFYCSWGLLAVLPTITVSEFDGGMTMTLRLLI